jgi:hypothetical protein
VGSKDAPVAPPCHIVRHRIGGRRLVILDPEDHGRSVARRPSGWVPVVNDGSFLVQESNSALPSKRPDLADRPSSVLPGALRLDSGLRGSWRNAVFSSSLRFFARGDDFDLYSLRPVRAAPLPSSLDPGCVKTRTGRIPTNYLYKFKPICRGSDGVGGLARPKVAQTSDTSAFLHSQDPELPFPGHDADHVGQVLGVGTRTDGVI